MIRRTPGVALYAQIADLLRSRIDDGTYGPGAQLPSEQRLADEYDVSGNTVRRALLLLRSEGLIESRTGYGSRVRMPADDLPRVSLRRGADCEIRPATWAERERFHLDEGEWVLVERLGVSTRVHPPSRFKTS